jgi:3-phosphoshikimate 1-carboxyvinyltransferase
MSRDPGPAAVDPLFAPLQATLRLPGSKSHANRAIIAACLCQGRTTLIENATPCDDVALMAENLRKMGFMIEWTDKPKGNLRIQGGMPAAQTRPVTLDCGNAGTTVRFLTSLCSVVPGEWVITGDAHMRTRPIADLVKTLRSLGAQIEDTDGCPPIRITGKRLAGGSVTLDASKSSQFLTSLLLIAPLLTDGLRVTIASALASPGYVDLTKNVLNDFGIQVKKEENTFIIQSSRYASPGTYRMEGDWSAAGAWAALAGITGGVIGFEGMNDASAQADRAIVGVMASLNKPGDITLDCTDIPDQVMNIAVRAAFRKGTVTVNGAANLRLKECDRLAVITSELKKAGIDIREHEDGVIVRGKVASGQKSVVSTDHSSLTTDHSVVLDPHDDHRMAMAFAVLGSVRPGIRITNPRCVSKSYPHFFADLRSVRGQTRPIAIVGMRAIGKSNLARRLASRLKLKFIDTDKAFERLHGKIPEYVQKHGWDAFRKEEERVVETSLHPGSIVSLGGGALESDRTRNVIKEKAVVIWMQATERLILQRLKIAKRPKLTDLPIEQEVRVTMQRRDPQFRQVATISLPAETRFGAQLPLLIKKIEDLTSSSREESRSFSQ